MPVCDHCQGHIVHVEDTHSMLVVLQRVVSVIGYSFGYSWHQCNKDDQWQHWHCTHDAMLDGVVKCVLEHHNDVAFRQVPDVRMFDAVLNVNKPCLFCDAPLATSALRFCLTQATPFNAVTDGSHDPLYGWCCCLAHAQQAAIAHIRR